STEEAGEYVQVGVLNRDVDVRTYNDMEVGDTWWFRLVGVDRLGRESDPSDPVSVTVEGIDGGDIIAGTIKGNRIEAGTLTVDLVEPGFGDAIQIDGNLTILAQQEAIDGVSADVTTVAGDVAAVADDV